MSELILRDRADRGDKNGARFHDFRALQEPRSQLCSRHKFLVKKNPAAGRAGDLNHAAGCLVAGELHLS